MQTGLRECLGSLVVFWVGAMSPLWSITSVSSSIPPAPLTPSEPTAPLMRTAATLEGTPPCHNETYFLSPSWDRGPIVGHLS